MDRVDRGCLGESLAVKIAGGNREYNGDSRASEFEQVERGFAWVFM